MPFQQLLELGPAKNESEIVPRYRNHQLWVGASLVKVFAVQAVCEDVFFTALERIGWPPESDNPFKGRGAYQRLRNVIARLNRDPLVRRHLRFGGNGRRGVRWYLIPNHLRSDAN